MSNTRNRCTFNNVTITNIFIKIEISRRLHSTAAAAVVDEIKISFNNIVFGVSLFKLEGTEDFSEFTVDTVFIVVSKVFDKLLSNGRTAELRTACCEIEDSTAGSFQVNAVMFPKSLVLNSNLSVNHLFWNVLKIYPNTIFGRVELFIFLPLLSFVILDINFTCLIEGDGIEIDSKRFIGDTENVEKK